jgi:hypothetical protein
MGGLISRLFLAERGVKGKESSRLSQNKSNLIFENIYFTVSFSKKIIKNQ